jgi:hypothetical protein
LYYIDIWVKSRGFITKICNFGNMYIIKYIKAINLGWDTDTIWALTWWIAGIYYGYEDIPKSWLGDLQKLNYLKEISEKFEEVFSEI